MSPDDLKRLRRLAFAAAQRAHVQAFMEGNPTGHVDDGTPEFAFLECPHPDCVLVRASAPSVAQCPDPFNETHEHQWVTETRCRRCGAAAPSVVEPAKALCLWTVDEDTGVLSTECGKDYSCLDDDPEGIERWMNFCCYCGKSVDFITEKPEPEEDEAIAPPAVEAKEPQ